MRYNIKVIGFDLVGTLVGENAFEINDVQDKMERLFGKNKSDYEYKKNVEEKISSEIDIEENTRYIINNIYEVKFPNLFFELKNRYPNVIFIIATNHVSYIRNYIERNFDMSIIDKIYVSAEMNKVKPDAGFYNYILNDLNIKASDSMYHLYDELNKDFGKDVMYKTYTEKAGIANLLAELIDGGYSTIDTINFIQYVNSNVYNEQGKNTFWYQGIEKYTDDYNINSEYIPDKNNDYDCHPKQYQKQITQN